MTPDTALTRSGRAPSQPGGPAYDLAAIRRTDAILDLLATRRLRRPNLLHDPAVLLLGALTEDVDSPAARPGGFAPAASAPPVTAAPDAHAAAAGRPSAADWTRAAAAAAVLATMAGAATTAGVMLTGVLMRVARNAAGPSGASWRAAQGGRGPRGPRAR